MPRKVPNAKTLSALYLDQKLTMAQIGSRYGVTAQSIHYHLARLGIGAASRGLDRGVLQSLYVDSRLSTPQIAAKLGVTSSKVKRNLVRYGIHRPRRLIAHLVSLHSHSDIERLYRLQGMNLTQAAAKLGITRRMFRRLLTHYGITHRHRGGVPRFDIDSDELQRLYIDERRTAVAIAKIFGCSSRTIRDRLQKLGIPIERGRYDPIK